MEGIRDDVFESPGLIKDKEGEPKVSIVLNFPTDWSFLIIVIHLYIQ